MDTGFRLAVDVASAPNRVKRIRVGVLDLSRLSDGSWSVQRRVNPLPDRARSPVTRRTERVDVGPGDATESYGSKDNRRQPPPRSYLNSPLS
jgi:hypothetical protein